VSWAEVYIPGKKNYGNWFLTVNSFSWLDKLICLIIFKPRENNLFEFERCIAETDQPDEKSVKELEDEDDDDEESEMEN